MRSTSRSTSGSARSGLTARVAAAPYQVETHTYQADTSSSTEQPSTQSAFSLVSSNRVVQTDGTVGSWQQIGGGSSSQGNFQVSAPGQAAPVPQLQIAAGPAPGASSAPGSNPPPLPPPNISPEMLAYLDTLSPGEREMVIYNSGYAMGEYGRQDAGAPPSSQPAYNMNFQQNNQNNTYQQDVTMNMESNTYNSYAHHQTDNYVQQNSLTHNQLDVVQITADPLVIDQAWQQLACLLYTSPSPRA